MNLNYQIIRHKNSLDVAFHVSNEDIWHESIVLKGTWYNQGFVKSFPIQHDQIQIMNKDLQNWLVLDEDYIPYIIGNACLRKTNNWIPIK